MDLCKSCNQTNLNSKLIENVHFHSEIRNYKFLEIIIFYKYIYIFVLETSFNFNSIPLKCFQSWRTKGE